MHGHWHWHGTAALLAAAALCLPPPAQSQPTLETRFIVDGDAEPVPALAYADDWHAPLEGGSDGLARLRWVTTVRRGDWSFGFDKLRLYRVLGNRDAARLYHRLQNELEFVPGERFDARVNMRQLEMTGLSIAHRWHDQAWSIEPRVRLLRLDHYLTGTLSGTATVDEQGNLVYAAQLDYVYDDDPLLERPVNGRDGWGASLDLDASYRIGAWRWRASIADLGALRVDDAPKTTGVADSATRHETDGGVSFDATLKGREFFEDSQMSLPWTAEFSAGRDIGRYDVLAGLRRTSIRYVPIAEAGWRCGEQTRVALLLESAARVAGGVKLQWHGLDVRFLSSSLDVADAHTLYLELGFGLSFF